MVFGIGLAIFCGTEMGYLVGLQLSRVEAYFHIVFYYCSMDYGNFDEEDEFVVKYKDGKLISSVNKEDDDESDEDSEEGEGSDEGKRIAYSEEAPK